MVEVMFDNDEEGKVLCDGGEGKTRIRKLRGFVEIM
jgi:hypothetical protein